MIKPIWIIGLKYWVIIVFWLDFSYFIWYEIPTSYSDLKALIRIWLSITADIESDILWRVDQKKKSGQTCKHDSVA